MRVDRRSNGELEGNFHAFNPEHSPVNVRILPLGVEDFATILESINHYQLERVLLVGLLGEEF